MEIKTAVLIHGYHREAVAWEETIWGDPHNGKYGKVPKGILEALKRDASLIIFGSGIHYEDGTIESRYIFEYMNERIAELASAAAMKPDTLKAWVEARVYFDEQSDRTENEMRHALQVASERGIERLYFISSPWHIMRCMKIALIESEKDPAFAQLRRNLYPVATDTATTGISPEDVVIFEPPHRPDRPTIPFNETLKGVFPFMRPNAAAIAPGFNDALKDLIREWTNKLPNN